MAADRPQTNSATFRNAVEGVDVFQAQTAMRPAVYKALALQVEQCACESSNVEPEQICDCSTLHVVVDGQGVAALVAVVAGDDYEECCRAHNGAAMESHGAIEWIHQICRRKRKKLSFLNSLQLPSIGLTSATLGPPVSIAVFVRLVASGIEAIWWPILMHVDTPNFQPKTPAQA